MATRDILPVALVQERNHGDTGANLAVVGQRVAGGERARHELAPYVHLGAGTFAAYAELSLMYATLRSLVLTTGSGAR